MSNQIQISVIIPTHNPKIENLTACLDSIKDQNFDANSFEIMIIDNGSSHSVETLLKNHDINFTGRIIQKKTIGLGHARLSGIKSASGALLVFVDDDNILDPNYLTNLSELERIHPTIGAFGAGKIEGVYEIPPPNWSHPYLHLLAIRNEKKDKWCNFTNNYEATPVGAGLCLRKEVAEQYTEDFLSTEKKRQLDRKGSKMNCGGDLDIAWTAVDIGMGYGVFTSLELKHKISKERLTVEYFEQLMEGHGYSRPLLFSLRDDNTPNPQMRSRLGTTLDSFGSLGWLIKDFMNWSRHLKQRKPKQPHSRFVKARLKGQERAYKYFNEQ